MTSATEQYPRTVAYRYDSWPECTGGVEMQFRLSYRGRLRAATRNDSRAKDKQAMRRVFREQLAELWRTHPFLSRFMQAHVRGVRFTPQNANAATLEELREQVFHTDYDDFSVADKMASRFAHNGFNFLPLVGSVFDGVGTACSIDILFLRRDDPGKIISGGGDIDNRLKVLMDALKMPKIGELPSNATPDEGESPFFCLVEDDSLVTEIKVTTDRLLTPRTGDEHENNVHLVIHVRTQLIDLSSRADMGAATAFLT